MIRTIIALGLLLAGLPALAAPEDEAYGLLPDDSVVVHAIGIVPPSKFQNSKVFTETNQDDFDDPPNLIVHRPPNSNKAMAVIWFENGNIHIQAFDENMIEYNR